ncbi:MAG: hydrolase 1, exosortase A system-associated [Burkholderiales bacterium]
MQAGATAERFVVFDVHGECCIGLFAPAAGPAETCAVLIVVGGPQYRVGSHREFALLARALAGAGIATLRFDYRGMGDSDGDARTFEAIDDDLAGAIDALCGEAATERVVLWGLCDGASAALMYAGRDPRVAGIVAVNPWVRSEQGAAATRLRHYYARRLMAPEFWRRLVAGGIHPIRAFRELAGTWRQARQPSPEAARQPFLARMSGAWRSLDRRMLVVLSGRDFTAREFEAWRAAQEQERPDPRIDALRDTVHFPAADHTFSSGVARDALSTRTIEWIRGLPR